MRSISLILKQLSRSILLVAGLTAMSLAARAQGDAAKGEALFKSKCTACHKLDQRMTGPALGPIITAETDDKWLTKWIQNNQAVIAAKDPKALKIYNEFNQASMTVFADLSDGDAANIIAYVRTEYKKMQETPKGGDPTKGAAAEDKGPSSMMIYGLLGVIVIAFIVILVLNKVIGTLERLLLKKKGLLTDEEEAEQAEKGSALATVVKLSKNKKLVFFFVFCGTLALGSYAWVTMWNTNVHQGYQPVQPIKFPHDLHAGVMKIQCQYCHSGAYKSKNATIPSLNICMNCHKTVKTESPEIHKIYDALGYDPSTAKYDSTKAHPMQWVRVHNLPDLAYFNHSQHVKVGKIKCQQCHGPIETMKEVYQYSPLTMKWCIQCHKRTEVDYKGNAYYAHLEEVHDKIKRGEKVTEKEMGGTECGKCHY
ncbi:quinol:cytochrome c oxidoreductase pentaheme cytochrome subunit [Mucilaginibacter yixingensis]|uniref:Quinol:cytochrome c oxidoreductase pentaheme cytochrome subunit n=1 Tax=Mucilaginibacter yixingensis TaxID=1295612 RepID=A0A2T5J752_9SPHI|nr:c-type cytochrome [Mucilaginibacter yixingensis]PTQ94970.1 quinol:cytochrome c oxidoreductase pentaheme cytochrome subunit [Mucilaginibacter yixingensis]